MKWECKLVCFLQILRFENSRQAFDDDILDRYLCDTSIMSQGTMCKRVTWGAFNIMAYRPLPVSPRFDDPRVFYPGHDGYTLTAYCGGNMHGPAIISHQ